MVGKKNLTTPQRNAVVQFLLRASVNGKPKRGMFKAAEEKFNISRTSIYRYWQAAKKQQEQGETINSVSGKITKGSRCKRVTLDLALLSSLHYTKRGSIRSLAVGLQCSKTTVGRWVDAGLIRAHTSAIRPDLTAPNKLLRLRFTLDALELDRVCNQIKFRNMRNWKDNACSGRTGKSSGEKGESDIVKRSRLRRRMGKREALSSSEAWRRRVVGGLAAEKLSHRLGEMMVDGK
ncbi:hypothetical protein SASPL_129624 [Salvia splendens]|uniref:DUF7769 domain-containing protein n=1 Tax=Salvia splendens TaxID=180675 RepID=A0A8X8XHI0_SALSN|nr:hypothetical protein SASPL_129624 [Salvia splendens]